MKTEGFWLSPNGENHGNDSRPGDRWVTLAELTGAELIAMERQRQITAEGWTPEHDDKYEENELPRAASCYIEHVVGRGWLLGGELLDAMSHIRNGKTQYRKEPAPDDWPWLKKWWKPRDKVQDLVRAGALIAAEIDRLQRAK